MLFRSYAFGEAGAVQCGFCIPGMVLAAQALLSKNPHPTEDEVREGLDRTIEAMDHLQVVEDGKPAPDDRAGELESVFKAGNDGRASLFEKGRNAAAAFSEITVPLKDVPGALLQVLEPLAKNGLNIRDIELMKVRENIAGTLLLAFKTPEEARRAVQILKLLGYDVKER